jgi:predicted dehydrogenase
MQSVAEETGCILAIAENYRRLPGNRAFAAVIKTGLLGDVFFTASQLVVPSTDVHGGGAWYRDRRISGSLIALEMGVHELDLLLYWFGDVKTVTGSVRVFEPEVVAGDGRRIPVTSEDSMFVRVDFASGVVGQITATMAGHGTPIGSRLAVGSRATMTSTSWENWQGGTFSDDAGRTVPTDDVVRRWFTDLPVDQRSKLFPPGTVDANHLHVDAADPVRYGVAHEIDDFARAIRDGKRPETDGEVASRALGASIAILESAWSKSTVVVDDVVTGRVSAWQDSLDRPNA